MKYSIEYIPIINVSSYSGSGAKGGIMFTNISVYPSIVLVLLILPRASLFLSIRVCLLMRSRCEHKGRASSRCAFGLVHEYVQM